MNTNAVRSESFWKSAILSMPDNSFYELMRVVFGKIKTPFNKQRLLDDLTQFLTRGDIQEIISVFIDQTDAKIIAAAAFLNEPPVEQMESFFADEFSAARLQDLIINLEERFILYRVSGNKLSINPVLYSALLPAAENISLLFPAAPSTGKTSPVRKKRENLIDFVLEQEPKALQILGLYYNEKTLVPDKKRLTDFLSLDPDEQNRQIAAALLICKTEKIPVDILPPLYRNKIRETANLTEDFLKEIKSEYQYPDITLKRMIEVLKAGTNACKNIASADMLKILRELNMIKKSKTPAAGNTVAVNQENIQLKKIISNFHSILKKMPINETEKTELSARIDRKLILSESQLKNADIRYEKLEARLMDYAGKQNIAKQAISGSSPVEIILSDRGKEKQIFGIPQAMEKEGDNLYLVIDNQRIPLAKIILIRKIKKSVFEV